MRVLALIGLACGAGVDVVHGQVTPALDAGISAVKYDGFLLSGAASLSPSVRWDHPGGRGSVSARGTYLKFESGNRSVDVSTSGSWFTPLARHWRGEVSVAAGASDYANVIRFSHGVAAARIHMIGAGRGGWISATVGSASFGAGPRLASVVALGAWLVRADFTMFASVDRAFIGDTTYTDVRSSGRLRRRGVLLEGTLGARVLSRGAGRGVYGEAMTTLPLGSRTALVVSAGAYPTDVISGSLAARYATLGLRLGAIATPRRVPRAFPAQVDVSKGANGSVIDPAADARLEIQAGEGDAVRLTVYAPGATAVEISGDFTDWHPVPLSRKPTNGDAWEASFRISRGIHRINVRRDGGRWMAPVGTTRTIDDYDGEVGLFLLP